MTETPDDSGALFDVEQPEPKAPEVKTDNEFALGYQLDCIRPAFYPTFRTRHEAYRFAAWLTLQAEMLKPEPGQPETFEEVLEAIKNT